MAARRLHAAASVVLLVGSLLAAAGVVGAVAVWRVDDGPHAGRWALVMGAASLMGWLWLLLPCLAAQAFARYMTARLPVDDEIRPARL